MAARNLIYFSQHPRRRRPQTFTSREQIMDTLSSKIMASPWSFKTIGQDTGLSASTVARVGRKETLWPTQRTMFSLLRYFDLDLVVREKK